MGGGGKGGGSRSTPIIPIPQKEDNPYTKQLANMASELWGQTAPIRTSFTDDYFMPFLKGNYDPATMPGFAPGYDFMRTGYEDAYNTARQNIEASTPRGGAMTNALAGNEYNRAKNIGLGTSQLSSNLIGDLWNKAYNTGWVTAPTQAFGGMGTAAGTEQSGLNTELGAQTQASMAQAQLAAQVSAANAARQQQGKSSGMGLLGTGIGSLAGLAMAPMTGGTSLMGSAMSGLGVGKGAPAIGSGITSGLGGYSDLMSNAMQGTGGWGV